MDHQASLVSLDLSRCSHDHQATPVVVGSSWSSSISWSVLISRCQYRLSYHQVFASDSQISLIYISFLATRDSLWFSRYSRTTRYLPVVLSPSRFSPYRQAPPVVLGSWFLVLDSRSTALGYSRTAGDHLGSSCSTETCGDPLGLFRWLSTLDLLLLDLVLALSRRCQQPPLSALLEPTVNICPLALKSVGIRFFF